MSAPAVGVAFDQCCGQGKGKAVPESMIHQNSVLGFEEGPITTCRSEPLSSAVLDVWLCPF